MLWGVCLYKMCIVEVVMLDGDHNKIMIAICYVFRMSHLVILITTIYTCNTRSYQLFGYTFIDRRQSNRCLGACEFIKWRQYRPLQTVPREILIRMANG